MQLCLYYHNHHGVCVSGILHSYYHSNRIYYKILISAGPETLVLAIASDQRLAIQFNDIHGGLSYSDSHDSIFHIYNAMFVHVPVHTAIYRACIAARARRNRPLVFTTQVYTLCSAKKKKKKLPVCGSDSDCSWKSR